MQKARRKRVIKTSPFISKLHEMLEDSKNRELINWDQDEGTFIIRHTIAFSNTVLPKYFRHSNYSSFLRQLNLYSFTKLRSDSHLSVFHHPLFYRGDFEKHRLIKRIDQQPDKYIEEVNYPNDNESEGLFFPEGSKIQQKIGVIKYNQRKLRQSCQQLISDNQEMLSDNYIFKATLEDESSNDRIILDRITAFMLHHYKDGHLEYCDSDMIKGLLKFLENNDWENYFSMQTPNAIAEFFKIVENNELKTAVKWISSLSGGERKKKNFTIIAKNGNFHEGERDILSILD